MNRPTRSVGLLVVEGIALVALLGACAPVPPPAPNAVIDQEETVWAAVAAQTDGSVEPLLRPGRLPAGVTAARLVEAGPGLFQVEYRSGDGVVVRIGAGGFSLPQPERDGAQRAALVRGQAATLQVQSLAHPDEQVFLWWEEPGFWRAPGMEAPRARVFYVLSSDGVPSDALLRLAGGLTPHLSGSPEEADT